MFACYQIQTPTPFLFDYPKTEHLSKHLNTIDEVREVVSWDFFSAGEKVEVEDFDGRTPLIYAGIMGNVDIIDYLAEVPVSILHKDKLGNSALYYAAERGHVDAVEVLLQNGAEVDAKNRRGITPLMIAASQGRNEIVRITS